jgi:hypothetical protein
MSLLIPSTFLRYAPMFVSFVVRLSHFALLRLTSTKGPFFKPISLFRSCSEKGAHQTRRSSNRCSSLATHPHAHPPPGRPLRFLELGSGIGSAGLTLAAALPARGVVSDLPNALPNLLHNTKYNAPLVASVVVAHPH